MKKKILRVYLLLVFLSIISLVIDRATNFKLGNNIYLIFSRNFKVLFFDFPKKKNFKDSQLLFKVGTLSYESQLYRELKKENEKLKEILEFKNTYPKKVIPAEIENKSPWEINLSFSIEKGSLSGIEVGAPVIGLKGVIGKVLKVGENSSIIQTLKSYNSAVSVKTTRKEIRGILKWNRKFFVEGIPKFADVKKGDTLVTSGEGSVFPKGLPIGVVSYISKTGNDYSLLVEVEPFEDLENLEFVFILKK
ncbi:MAG: rod shape-determining protein MreC [candidate division WOR-3 bacterium]